MLSFEQNRFERRRQSVRALHNSNVLKINLLFFNKEFICNLNLFIPFHTKLILHFYPDWLDGTLAVFRTSSLFTSLSQRHDPLKVLARLKRSHESQGSCSACLLYVRMNAACVCMAFSETSLLCLVTGKEDRIFIIHGYKMKCT